MYENHQIAFGTASFGTQNSANSYCQDDIKEAQLALETVISVIEESNCYCLLI